MPRNALLSATQSSCSPAFLFRVLLFSTFCFLSVSAKPTATPPTPSSLRINVGGKDVYSGGQQWYAERPDQLFGVSFPFEVANDTEIAMTEFDTVYQTQRYGTLRDSGDPIWGYNIALQPGVYSLTLHFAELWDGVFLNGQGPRVFHVAVGDNGRGYQSVQRDLDIYKSLRDQENSALTKTFTNLLVTSTLIIRFFPVTLTPALNAISAERIGPLPRHIFRVQVNAGGEATSTGFIQDHPSWVVSKYSDTTEVQDEDLRYRLFSDIDGALHVKQRISFGKKLAYEVPVPETGSFDVTLLFAENYVKSAGKRVFDIAVGDKENTAKAQRVTGYDIFVAAGNAMYTPVERTFTGVTAPSGTIRIELTAVVENLILSAFVIKRPGQQVFVTTSNPVFNSEGSGYDHQSHAVAGKDVFAVDFDRDGFALVELDGSLSHSHFFEPGPPSVAGRIVKHTWIVDKTNQVLGTSEKLVAPFPVGNTVVRLEVTDNTGDMHTDKVVVRTLDREVPGVYSYFYDSRLVQDEIVPNGGDFSIDRVLPQEGRHLKSLEFVELKDYHWFSFMDLAFQARFLCNVTVPKSQGYVFVVDHLKTSPVKLFVNRVQLDLKQDGDMTQTASVNLVKGENHVEVLFYRIETKSIFNAMLKVVFYPEDNKKAAQLLGDKSATYDAGAVQPTIHSVMPKASQLNGGGRFRITGSGFVVSEPSKQGVTVRIRNSTTITSGNSIANNDSDSDDDNNSRADKVLRGDELRDLTTWSMEFTAPKHDKNETLLLSVHTNAGESNLVPIEYSETASQPIRFRETNLMMKNKTFEIGRPTSIALGPDLRLYIGTMDGFVFRVSVDYFTNEVIDRCQSSAPGPNRAVLGLAFNPYEMDPSDIRLYITTSTLFWKSRGDADNVGWANGKVQLMKRDVGGFCLGVVKDVVSGLPVSNYDHAVNGMSFDSQGNLYIAVGSSTNAGVSKPDDALGGVPDSPLSASIVVAYLSKPGFNGTVLYDQYDNPGTAHQISGDVEVFASGVRNTYDLIHHSSGEIYASSNSANFGFGAMSTSCTTEKEVNENGYADQIIRVSKDSYHGHPNRNRGRTDKRQCVFYSAETHPNGVEGVFRKPLALVESSTDGIIEYTANTFDFQLRGDLFASKFAVGTTGKLFRLKMNATTGNPEFTKPEEFHQASGLSLTMVPTGGMVMPQIVQGKVLVLEPEESLPKGPYITSVFPTRGPLKGGYRVVITGYNFGNVDKLHVLFDGIEAENVKLMSDNGRQISCTIPSGKVAGHITVQVRAENGELSPTIGKDFEYIERT